MPSRPTKKMLIVPFVNPFSQKEESIGRGGERAQLAAAAGGEGEGGSEEAGRPSGPYPTGTLHFEWRRKKGKRGGGGGGEGGGGDGQLERRRGRQSFPLFSLLGVSGGGNTIHPWLDCENGEMHFRATPRHRDVVTRQFPSPSSSSSLALPWG